MKQVCILSAFWKHGWIHLKLGMQVSIEKSMIENENRVKKIPKKFTTCFLFFACLRPSGTKKKIWKFLVEILQYTKNLKEIFTFQLA
jgi:hypothetical protein